MEIKPFSIVLRKDLSGFCKKPTMGSLSMLFLGVSPQNPKLAVVAITREAVVGTPQDVSIVRMPYSTITLEPMDNLIVATKEVLIELGITDAVPDNGIEFNPYTNPIAKAMVKGLLPQKGTVPEGTKCSFCGSTLVNRTFIPTGGPYSGRITCNECGKTESVLKHVTDRAFTVEPIDERNNAIT